MSFSQLFGPCFLVFFIALSVGCGTTITQQSNTAQGLYEYAEALGKDERFEEAIVAHSEVKNKHPYSRYSTLSELAIADIHFRRESYIESQTAYEIFKSLHPKHPKNDLVTFRIGMSYFYQLPTSVDRDLGLASKAIFQFDQVSRAYPNSEYVEEAIRKKAEVRRRLAEKELYIARFYLKNENYTSALGRFQKLLQNFPENGFAGEALFGASLSAFMTELEEDGKKYYERLVSQFPNSDFTARAREELIKYVER